MHFLLFLFCVVVLQLLLLFLGVVSVFYAVTRRAQFPAYVCVKLLAKKKRPHNKLLCVDMYVFKIYVYNYVCIYDSTQAIAKKSRA